MELISVSALEIRFDNRPDDDVLLVMTSWSMCSEQSRAA
ncbi:hypothetical protein PVE_R2G0378 [Pseudomonas veronii 1YdBTEX2]|uniref:Uncharacterized protein n=1 Tax=Pseudomonas veronii 1YdBTEX2 TaxID=1295141 RepID=A0A1D3K821_PSEVE|nr:hypothetical protein PVE_R2G0378 [Pseudomonas veronii 1YdBTEX2]